MQQGGYEPRFDKTNPLGTPKKMYYIVGGEVAKSETFNSEESLADKAGQGIFVSMGFFIPVSCDRKHNISIRS